MNDRLDQRIVIQGGPNATEALRVIARQVPPEALEGIRAAAARVIQLSIDPRAGAAASNGLIYGMVQSGKTGVLTVAAAMAIDNGFDGLIVLTSDIDDLYDQTVDRVRQMLRGVTVLGKNDWLDVHRLRSLVRSRFGVVCSKNGRMLASLRDKFHQARAGKLSLFIVDDEADQASLDTNARKRARRAVDPSTVNDQITALRKLFSTNTYVQVTATPQALFMQQAGHPYRPSFTVLTDPGPGYVGGDEFFGENSPLLDFVDLAEVSQLQVGNQPTPRTALPRGLRRALVTFLIAAGARALTHPAENFAFLCHVSMSTPVHRLIVGLINEFRDSVIATSLEKTTRKYADLVAEMRTAYDGLAITEKALPGFQQVVDRVEFLIHGASVKLINAQSNDEDPLGWRLQLSRGRDEAWQRRHDT